MKFGEVELMGRSTGENEDGESILKPSVLLMNLSPALSLFLSI